MPSNDNCLFFFLSRMKKYIHYGSLLASIPRYLLTFHTSRQSSYFPNEKSSSYVYATHILIYAMLFRRMSISSRGDKLCTYSRVKWSTNESYPILDMSHYIREMSVRYMRHTGFQSTCFRFTYCLSFLPCFPPLACSGGPLKHSIVELAPLLHVELQTDRPTTTFSFAEFMLVQCLSLEGL